MRSLACCAAVLAVVLVGAAPASAHRLDAASAWVVGNTSATDCGACQDSVTKCFRVTEHRVDCVVVEDAQHCNYVVATRLLASGRLEFGSYASCQSASPPFTRDKVIRRNPPGLLFAPLTKSAFEDPGLVNLKKHQKTPYGTTVWLGRVSSPVPVGFSGSSEAGEAEFHVVDGRLFVPVSYVNITMVCPDGPVNDFVVLNGLRVPRSGRIDSKINNRSSDGTVVSVTHVRATFDAKRTRFSGTVFYKELESGGCAMTRPQKFSAKR